MGEIPKEHGEWIKSTGNDRETVDRIQKVFQNHPDFEEIEEEGWSNDWNSIEEVRNADEVLIDMISDLGQGINQIHSSLTEIDEEQLTEESREYYTGLETQLDQIKNDYNQVLEDFYWEEEDSWLKSVMVDTFLRKGSEQVEEYIDKRAGLYDELESIASGLNQLEYYKESSEEPEKEPSSPEEPTSEPSPEPEPRPEPETPDEPVEDGNRGDGEWSRRAFGAGILAALMGGGAAGAGGAAVIDGNHYDISVHDDAAVEEIVQGYMVSGHDELAGLGQDLDQNLEEGNPTLGYEDGLFTDRKTVYLEIDGEQVVATPLDVETYRRATAIARKEK